MLTPHRARLIAAALAMAISLAACGGNDDDDQNAPPSSEQPSEGEQPGAEQPAQLRCAP